MVSVLASSTADRGFEPRSGQTKNYKIGICCFSTKNAALRSKSKDWLARNHNNVSEWSDMSTRGLLFQWASTIKIPTKRVGLEQSRPHHHLIENNLISPWDSWKINELALNNNHSLMIFHLSDWLLLNAKWTICPIYHGENKWPFDVILLIFFIFFIVLGYSYGA
jgi:hypothetical protein